MDNLYNLRPDLPSQNIAAVNVSINTKENCDLSKEEQGTLSPVKLTPQTQKLGTCAERCINETWESDSDDININEDVSWISSEGYFIKYEDMLPWIVRGPMKTQTDDDVDFCDEDILKNVLRVKQEVFQKFSTIELSKARTRANPFETIRCAFFMNRAALKMANIDAATGFMFSSIDRDPRHRNINEPYYFADVCAGPGGFTEYMLWRKQWAFKGFGFTLKGKHDFKLSDSVCCSSVSFKPQYGSHDDGNACNPDNIRDFTKNIMHETNNCGVHFMMADGGFSVEGSEQLQEILSKQIYLCQCLIGLEIIRKHGHFITKMFDVFTHFSVGLIFLMYQCFDKITILKPNSSRPANSERYLVCAGLKDSPIIEEVRKYLRVICNELWHSKHDNEINEIVPLNIIKGFISFTEYITQRNNNIATKQMKNLMKLSKFCQNPSLVEPRQDELRIKSLEAWNIPHKAKILGEPLTIESLLTAAVGKREFLHVQPRIINSNNELSKIFTDISDWSYVPLSSCKMINTCNLIAGVGSKSYRLLNYKWTKVKNLKLVRGTLLFGEMVFEKSSEKQTLNETDVRSLHVIDALRLGETSLADLSFQERVTLIEIYCKSLNFETHVANRIRIRPKPSGKLIDINTNNFMHYDTSQGKYISLLPTIGIRSCREYFSVNSILLFKTDETQFFNTSYVLRVQLFIDLFDSEGQEDEDGVGYECLLKYVKNNLK